MCFPLKRMRLYAAIWLIIVKPRRLTTWRIPLPSLLCRTPSARRSFYQLQQRFPPTQQGVLEGRKKGNTQLSVSAPMSSFFLIICCCQTVCKHWEPAHSCELEQNHGEVWTRAEASRHRQLLNRSYQTHSYRSKPINQPIKSANGRCAGRVRFSRRPQEGDRERASHRNRAARLDFPCRFWRRFYTLFFRVLEQQQSGWIKGIFHHQKKLLIATSNAEKIP